MIGYHPPLGDPTMAKLPLNMTRATIPAHEVKRYQKIAVTQAVQMAVPFVVDTPEGPRMEGRAGDYLCIDAEGNRYPCKRTVFEASYRQVHPPEPCL